MRKTIFLTIIFLIIISSIVTAESYVAINSRGELVACNDNGCNVFNPDDRGVNYLPKDYFNPDEMSNTDFLYYKNPKWFSPNFNIAELGGNVYALDLDGNLWKCNSSAKNCSEINLGISGFKIVNPTSTTEKNLNSIVAGINTLFITGRDGRYFSIWEYNPANNTTTQKYKDNSNSLVPTTSYSKVHPFFKNVTSIGFIGYNRTGGTSFCFKPVKINYTGEITTGDINCVSGYWWANLEYIIPGINSGYLEIDQSNGDIGYEVDVSINSSNLKPTISWSGAITSFNSGVAWLNRCTKDGSGNKEINIYSMGSSQSTKVPLTINGANIDCGPDYSYSLDVNYSRYFDPHHSALWFTFDDAGNKRLGACYYSSSVSCIVSNLVITKETTTNINAEITQDAVQGFENSLFVKSISNKVNLCNSYGSAMDCTEFPTETILTRSRDWSGELIFSNPVNQFRVTYGKFASLLTSDYVGTIPPGKAFYVIDSVGALYSCGLSAGCNIVNPGIMFHEINRIVDYSKYSNLIVAWDSAGKLWNCAMDGSGCILKTKEKILQSNLKITTNNFVLTSDCNSYHIPNSDCNNNCLNGFKKINNYCVPVNPDEVFGVYFHTSSEIYRCTKDSCKQLLTTDSVNTIKTSQYKGIIAIIDEEKIVECFNDSCNTMYSETGFKPINIIPSKSGVFATTYNYDTSEKKIIFVEYGKNNFVTLTNKNVNIDFSEEGYFFEDSVYIAENYCNKFGCNTHANIGFHDNIGGLYKFGYSPNIGYFYSQNDYISYYPVNGSDYGQIAVFDSGAAIPAISNNKKNHTIISPYFAHQFNSLDVIQMPPVSGIVEEPGFGGAYIKEENAWLVKANLLGNNIYDGIAYCTEYGCKKINCDLNFYSRAIHDGYYGRRLMYHIVPSYEVRPSEGITILGYVIDQNAKDNSPGKVMAIIRQDGETYPECVNLNSTNNNWKILPASNGGAFVTHSVDDENMSYCYYPNCTTIKTETEFNIYVNTPDNSGGLFISDEDYDMYYCDSLNCKKILDQPRNYIDDIVPAYQSVIGCGDNICTPPTENIETCPEDCNGLNYDFCCGLNARNYLTSQTTWLGTGYMFFCPDKENSEFDWSTIIFPGLGQTTYWNCLCEGHGSPTCYATRGNEEECKNEGEECSVEEDCCEGLTCDNELCMPEEPCKEQGENCIIDEDCCSENCVLGVCAQEDYCVELNNFCLKDSDCCSNWCHNNNCDISPEQNNIIDLELKQSGCKIIASAKCESDTSANIIVRNANNQIVIPSKTISCNFEPAQEVIDNNCDFQEGTYSGNAEIKSQSPQCNRCEIKKYFSFVKQQQTIVVPDNNFLIIFLSIVFLTWFSRKKNNI